MQRHAASSGRYLMLWCLLALGALSGEAAGASTEQLKEVTQELVCLCGSCNHESLSTCICGFAEGRRQEIVQALDEGKTQEAIIAQLIDQYGRMVLAAPPARGYNLLAWITPFALLILGIVVLRAVLLNWRRNQGAAATQSGPADAAAQDGNYQDRLRRELDSYEAD